MLYESGPPLERVATPMSCDAGISAALRARDLDPSVDVTVVVADAYPNYSICGIPMLVSGEVPHWTHLAHRTRADLEATGMQLRLDTRATKIDVAGQFLHVIGDGREEQIAYDELVVGTGALPATPPIEGINELNAADGVHVLHSMGDTFAVLNSLESAQSALIVGAGYVGLEMAEGLIGRGLSVVQVERLPRCCRPSTRSWARWCMRSSSSMASKCTPAPPSGL